MPADFVEAEQKKHGSQKRFPSNSGRDGMLFLCGTVSLQKMVITKKKSKPVSSITLVKVEVM